MADGPGQAPSEELDKRSYVMPVVPALGIEDDTTVTCGEAMEAPHSAPVLPAVHGLSIDWDIAERHGEAVPPTPR